WSSNVYKVIKPIHAPLQSVVLPEGIEDKNHKNIDKIEIPQLDSDTSNKSDSNGDDIDHSSKQPNNKTNEELDLTK
ncbi:3789_t:CDS:2, partial [Racocetra fulgida]